MPINLLVHHCPSTSRLVVGQDNAAIIVKLLQVNGAADVHAIGDEVNALLNNVVVVLAVLQDAMNCSAKDGPDHVCGVLCQFIPMLALELYDARAIEQLGHRHVGLAFVVLWTADHVDDRLRQVVDVGQLHDKSRSLIMLCVCL